jgi:hypothetical protein
MPMWGQLAMGLALNLIASAIVYKVRGQSPALVLFGIGVLIMGFVAVFARKNKPTAVEVGSGGPVSSNSTTTNTDSFKQSLQNVGNATATASPVAVAKYEEHHHYHSPSAQPFPALEPRLVIGSQYRPALIDSSIWGRKWVEVATPGVFGILIPVTNEAPDNGEPVGKATDIVAAIEFHDSTGKQIYSIPRAYWLGEEANRIDLELGDTAAALLATTMNGHLFVYSNQEAYGIVRYGRRRPPSVIVRPRGFQLGINGYIVVTIKIISLDMNRTMASKKFRLTSSRIGNGLFEVEEDI